MDPNRQQIPAGQAPVPRGDLGNGGAGGGDQNNQQQPNNQVNNNPRAPNHDRILSEFPTYNTWEDCLTAAGNLFPPGFALHTTLETQLLNVPVSYQYLRDMAQATNRGARSGVASRYLCDMLGKAAPFKVGLWMLNTRVWDVALNEVSKPAYNDLCAFVAASSGVAQTPQEQLDAYRQGSNRFREAMGDWLPAAVFRNPSTEIQAEVRVAREHLVGLTAMLTDIVNKRENALQGNRRAIFRGPDKPKINGETFSADHYTDYYDVLTLDSNPMNVNLKARSASGAGIITADFPHDGVKAGPLLLSTALEQHIRINGINLNIFEASTLPAIVHAVLEVRQMRVQNEAQRIENEQNRQAGQYAQQCANMDIVFNFFLQIQAFGLRNHMINIADRKLLNSFLYRLGRKIIGKDKISDLMTRAGGFFTTIAGFFNKTGSIHMPPFALTTSRLYDWVAVFGILRLGDMRVNCITPGISTRYFTHFRITSALAMGGLLVFNTLEKEANSEILESEHMLHQMLLTKGNAYQSSLNVTGNAFAVRFIPVN